MPPKSGAKRKAEKASRRSVEVRKQQRQSFQSTAGAIVSLPPPLPRDRALETSSSVTVRASVSLEQLPGPSEELPGPSRLPTHTASIVESESFEEDVTNLSFEEDRASLSFEEDVGATGSIENNTKTSQEIMGKFVEEWLQVLGKEDMKSMAIFLCYQLVGMFSFTETKAAEYAAQMINKSEITVRRWRSSLIDNDGVFPESEHGKHQRSVLWKDEDLNRKATEYVRSNDAVKGRPNLTSIDFCHWVNDSLLPNSTLEPGFPRKVCLETARKWLHELGFEVLTTQKGIFIDGHERSDVIESRKLFLRKMFKLGFLHFTNAPTDDAATN